MFKIVLVFLLWLFFVVYFLGGEGLVSLLMGVFELEMSEVFFLRACDLEGNHFFYLFYLMVFYSLLLGIIPFSKNELMEVLFSLGFLLWVTGCINSFSVVLFVEEGGILSYFMYILAVVRVLVQPVTLSLRIFVNLLLGESIMLLLVFFNSSLMFFRGFYELFVVFLQRRVFCFLLLSYFKN